MNEVSLPLAGANVALTGRDQANTELQATAAQGGQEPA